MRMSFKYLLSAAAIATMIGLSAPALAAEPTVTAELMTGYLIQAPVYQPTNNPVLDIEVFKPFDNGTFLAVGTFTEVTDNPGVFDGPGDEFDVTLGYKRKVGENTWSVRTSAYLTPGAGNDIALVEGGVSRDFGQFTVSTSIEAQRFGGEATTVIGHLGVGTDFAVGSVPFRVKAVASHFDDGRDTLATTVSFDTTFGLPLIHNIRTSLGDWGESRATYGIAYRF